MKTLSEDYITCNWLSQDLKLSQDLNQADSTLYALIHYTVLLF